MNEFGWTVLGQVFCDTVSGFAHRIYNNQSEVSSGPRLLRKAWDTGNQLFPSNTSIRGGLLALILFSIEE